MANKKTPKLKTREEKPVVVDDSTLEEETDNNEENLNDVLNAAKAATENVQNTEDEEDTEGEPENSVSVKSDSEKPNDSGIIISAPKSAPTKATSVDIITVADHSCFIGGIPYHFKKGVKTSVPKPVKDILRNAGLLAPL